MLIGLGGFVRLLILSEMWAMMVNLLFNLASQHPLTIFSPKPSFIIPFTLAVGTSTWMFLSDARTKHDLDALDLDALEEDRQN